MCVPTANAVPVLSDADPLLTAAGVPIAVDVLLIVSNSCTIPAGVPPVTLTVTAKAVPEDDFTVVTVSVVIVDTSAGGVGVELPPPQPSVKLSAHSKPSPSAARYRFLPGRMSSTSAANPVPPLNVHQPLALPFGGALAAHRF